MDRLSGGATALLHELEALLEKLAQTGEGGLVELKGLPFLPGERESLEAFLGTGEVSAEIDALGPSFVRETAFHGVWWVTHCNAEEEVVAEWLEVAPYPAILTTPPEDVAESAARLRASLGKGEDDE